MSLDVDRHTSNARHAVLPSAAAWTPEGESEPEVEADSDRDRRLFGWRDYQEVDCRHWDDLSLLTVQPKEGIMSNIVARQQSSIVSTVSSRTSRALARIEERALLRAAEIQGIAYVGHTALRAIAEISMAEEELAKVAPPSARLRMAAVGDAVTASIQGRVLDLMDGL